MQLVIKYCNKQAISMTETGTKKKDSDHYLSKYAIDTRNKETRLSQLSYFKQLSNQNIKLWHIELTQKMKVNFPIGKLVKAQFDHGWYAMITDNCIQSQYAVLTLHGGPGNHIEWAGLESQMGKSVRWINFVIPGFDGFDQRRGTYSGSAHDLAKLIYLVLESRKLTKVVFCAHSFGSIVTTFFITQYPHIVKGFVSFAGITYMMSIGIMMMYSAINSTRESIQIQDRAQYVKNINNDQFRKKVGQKFAANSSSNKYADNVQVVGLNVNQICAVYKFFSTFPEGIGKYFEIHHRLRMFRVLLYGGADKVVQTHKAALEVIESAKGSKVLTIKDAHLRDKIEKKIKQEYGVNINAQKLQQYFCFLFEQTGHNPHKRRPKQISKILKIYLTVIKVIDDHDKQQLMAKL